METQSTSTALAHDLSKLYGLRVSVQHAPRIRGLRFYPTASVLTESLGTPGRRQTAVILDPRTRMHACTHACTSISVRALAREQVKVLSPRVLLKHTTRRRRLRVLPYCTRECKKRVRQRLSETNVPQVKSRIHDENHIQNPARLQQV